MSDVIIGDILPYTQAIATANQTVFATNWTANYYTDVVVYQTPSGSAPNDATQILTSSQFSVAFIGASLEVQVTLVTPANAGDIITITRMTPAERENIYTNTNFTPSMLNNDFGILTLVDQQAQLVNQLIAPRYNYSAIIAPNSMFPNANIILPILGANQIWAKNGSNTAIVAVTISGGGINGTVTPGAPNELAFYASSGNTVQGLATANNGVLVTSTTGVPSILASPNSTGNIFVSNAGAPPSFSTAEYPLVAGAAGTLLTSNGTNIVNTTATYPSVAGTAGTILTSDGTNFVESSVVYPNVAGWTAYTPVITLSGGTGNVVPTFTQNSGRYQQVGNVVFVEILMANSTGGTAGAGTGQMQISLPITAGANSLGANMFCGFIVNGAVSYALGTEVMANSNLANLTLINGTSFAGVAGSGLNNANMRQIQCKFFYEI